MPYREFIEKSLLKAGEIAEDYFGKVEARSKDSDPNQVLTDADIAIGKLLVSEVATEFPDHNIIDEEAGVVDNSSQYTWVIDPIEATSNFAAGLPYYGIMIGLLDRDEPIAGGVYAPAMNRMYLAEKDKGATCNGSPIAVSKNATLAEQLVSFGIDSNPDNPELTKKQCSVLADIVLACRNMRNTGCEALDPMHVAEGALGARVNTTSKIWDNVGPQIIASEAGALWTTANGEPIDYSNPLNRIDQNFTFCVASPAIQKQLTEIIAGRLD
ncbi:TPA: inositol monophosphatase [Candidatus Saccharibacteria bacterium]|nr:inositol monophosphatase [Candidatus Saccharibacteria bacterium]HIO87764.1 inositol monophosphatase [Candidatus Saccharibacteria bacterium]